MDALRHFQIESSIVEWDPYDPKGTPSLPDTGVMHCPVCGECNLSPHSQHVGEGRQSGPKFDRVDDGLQVLRWRIHCAAGHCFELVLSHHKGTFYFGYRSRAWS